MKLSDSAYAKLKEKLFAGELSPGQFISQRQLVKLIDVPLGPVREALQRLEADGLVQIAPQRGIQFNEASLQFIRNTYQLRLFVEKEAAANSQRMRAMPRSTPLKKAIARSSSGPRRRGFRTNSFMRLNMWTGTFTTLSSPPSGTTSFPRSTPLTTIGSD